MSHLVCRQLEQDSKRNRFVPCGTYRLSESSVAWLRAAGRTASATSVASEQLSSAFSPPHGGRSSLCFVAGSKTLAHGEWLSLFLSLSLSLSLVLISLPLLSPCLCVCVSLSLSLSVCFLRSSPCMTLLSVGKDGSPVGAQCKAKKANLCESESCFGRLCLKELWASLRPWTRTGALHVASRNDVMQGLDLQARFHHASAPSLNDSQGLQPAHRIRSSQAASDVSGFGLSFSSSATSLGTARHRRELAIPVKV